MKKKKKNNYNNKNVDTVRKTIAMELHRPVRRNFVRRAVKLKGLYALYQADLVEMIPHAKVNKGYKCLMTVINAFSAPVLVFNGTAFANLLNAFIMVIS